MKLEFKPAVLGKPKRYEILDGAIHELDGAGQRRSTLKLDDVQEVRWHQTYARFFISRGLELSVNDGKTKLLFAQVMPARYNAQHPDIAAFFRTASAALNAVADAKPGLEIAMAQPPLMRWVGFGFWIAFVGIMIFAASVLLESRHARALWWLAVIFGAGILFSLFMAWKDRPWRAPERMSPHELSDSLIEQTR